MQTEQDFFDLTDAYLARAASEGVRHTEIMFDPQGHLNRWAKGEEMASQQDPCA